MRICFAALYYNPRTSTGDPAGDLARFPLYRDLPQALAARGHRVDLVHLYPQEHEFDAAGVQYHYVAEPPAMRWLSHTIARPGRDAAVYQPAIRSIQRIVELAPDVIHFHGLTLTWNLLLLTHHPGRHAPIVAHYHGGLPPTHRLARLAQRSALTRVDRLLFTSAELAQPFVDAAILRDTRKVVELVETSTSIQPLPRDQARRLSGMHGDPVFLWAARLHPDKDPLTALRGFEIIAGHYPQARLYLYYLTGELESELRAYVAARPELAARVEFRGRATPTQMVAIHSSADYLLQASRREVASYAVLEAMVCGTIPVLSNIPASRALTNDGHYGILFSVGDAAALARGVLAIPPGELAARSAAVRAHFEHELSFAAMARRLEALYMQLARVAP